MRLRPIKKRGSSYAIHLTKEDMVDFDLVVDELVDIEDIVKHKGEKNE